MSRKPLLEQKIQKFSPEYRNNTFPAMPVQDKRYLLVNRISNELIKKGWSYTRFASHLGKHQSEISKWMSGRHNFTLDTLFEIERVLNIELVNTSGSKQQNVKIFGAKYGVSGGAIKNVWESLYTKSKNRISQKTTAVAAIKQNKGFEDIGNLPVRKKFTGVGISVGVALETTSSVTLS